MSSLPYGSSPFTETADYCGLPGIFPDITHWCMTCLNTNANTVLIEGEHTGTALEMSLMGPHWHNAIWAACSSSCPVVCNIWDDCFSSSTHFCFRAVHALETSSTLTFVGGGREALGMKWDTFMEYCMLNNRLREGVMSLSRKHKHYVLIRRLIINKAQGRCSESRLFHWYLLGQRALLIGQLKSTLLQSLIGITTFTDFLGTVLPFSLPLH